MGKDICEEDCDEEQHFFNGVQWECPNCGRTWDAEEMEGIEDEEK